MDRNYDLEYELKARTYNATNFCNDPNHKRNLRSKLVFGCGPNGLRHVISWIGFLGQDKSRSTKQHEMKTLNTNSLFRSGWSRRQLSLPQSIQFINAVSQCEHIPFRRRAIVAGGAEAVAQLIVRQLGELR